MRQIRHGSATTTRRPSSNTAIASFARGVEPGAGDQPVKRRSKGTPYRRRRGTPFSDMMLVS